MEELDRWAVEVADDGCQGFMGKVSSAKVGRFAVGAGCDGHGRCRGAKNRVGRVVGEDNTISCDTTVQAR